MVCWVDVMRNDENGRSKRIAYAVVRNGKIADEIINSKRTFVLNQRDIRIDDAFKNKWFEGPNAQKYINQKNKRIWTDEEEEE